MSAIRNTFFLIAALAALPRAEAASFSITSGTNTSAQTLSGTNASPQSGSVSSGATLTGSGTNVPVTISGNSSTLTNLGTISQTGTGRAVFVSSNVTGLVINNGSATNSTALIQAADADVLRGDKANVNVTLNNYGTLNSLNPSKGGSQAVDFNPITTGTNVINNFSTGQLLALDADAVRPGVNGTINNSGTIKATTTSTTGNSSDGIDGQNNAGFTVNNSGSGLIEGARHGITGGALNSTVSYTATISNTINATIQGKDGSGINLDGFNSNQVVGITNAGTISGYGVTGDGDGIDVDGLVNIVNTGTIVSYNAVSAIANVPAHSEGITVGGGTIDNSGTIKGMVASGNTNAVGFGITLLGNDVTTGPLAGTREAIYGDATVTNRSGGLIQGQSESAIFVDGPASGHTVSITNLAGGTIQGGGSASAAILTGADNDTLTNSGTINGTSSGVAVNLGAGNNTMSITGGSASISGDVNGGVGGTNQLSIAPGAGNNFAYSNVLSNFSAVEILSGMVTLSGVNTYAGTTKVSGGTLKLSGANRVSSSSSLQLNGGTLETAGAGGANGQSFASLGLSNNSSLDLDASSLTFGGLGTITAGKTLAILDYSDSVSPGYAIRIAGNLTSDATFRSLLGRTTVNGNAAVASFDGTYTDVMAAPEPSTIALGCLGLLVLPVIRRKRSAGR